MNILSILGQPISVVNQSAALSTQIQPQQQHRSRLRHKAEALLRQQAQGKWLRNQQKRIVIRWQTIQRRKVVEGGCND